MKYTKIIILLFFLFISCHSFGQRVGLVLSGGGAKGLYHVGVIKALEENGIPIDYISGTSMGAIIGGLYASGMSAEQMVEEFLNPEVNQWLSGEIDPKNEYYFKKMRRDASMFTLRFDFKNKEVNNRVAHVPANIISSSQIDLAFVEYFSASSMMANNNFDNLFIPFRCAATDLSKRNTIIMRDGDLSKAIRASMSIPFLYSPVRADSVRLYDGGITNNFPWQVLKEDFKPDILIGSKSVEGLPDLEKNNLLDQVFSLFLLHTDYDLPGEDDIMIDRVFNDINMMDFTKVQYIIDLGYSDAMAKMAEIKSKIKRRVDPEQVQSRREIYANKLPGLIFQDYHIEGLDEKQTAYVKKLLRINHKNEYFTIDKFKKEYFKILSENEIEGEYPSVTFDNQTGMFDLDIRMKVKPSFKLMLGGNISSTALNQAYIGLEYKTIRRSTVSYNLDFYLSSFYSSVWLGSRVDFFLNQPIYLQYGAMMNYYNYFRSDFGMISKYNDLNYSKYLDLYASSEVGMPLNTSTVANVVFHGGINQYRYYLDENYSDIDTMDKSQFNFVGFQANVVSNNTNHRVYPTKGFSQNMSLIYVIGQETLERGGYVYANSPMIKQERNWFGVRYQREQYLLTEKVNWFTLGYMVDLVLTNHPDFYNTYATNLSSPTFSPTPHSKLVYLKEYRSSSYAGMGVLPIFEVNDNFHFRTGAYFFLPGNSNVDGQSVKERMKYIFDVSAVYHTMLGSVSLSVSKYDSSQNNNWFMSFNFGYSIFNSKGLFY